jgi:hypothetical protein
MSRPQHPSQRKPVRRFRQTRLPQQNGNTGTNATAAYRNKHTATDRYAVANNTAVPVHRDYEHH